MNRLFLVFVVFLALVVSSLAYAECTASQKAQAQKVKAMLNEMASPSEKDGKLYYSWHDDWHAMTLPQKEQITRVVADTDACLTGKAREIYIHYRGELVAKASPTWGIKVIK